MARRKKSPEAREYSNSRFAGEMLVAAELARLGYQVLLGNIGSHNTTGADMSAHCPISGRSISISVKSLKSPNAFILDPEKVLPETVYVFVMTGPAGALPRFHVVRGSELLAREEELFGKWGRGYRPKSARGIEYKGLAAYVDRWDSL